MAATTTRHHGPLGPLLLSAVRAGSEPLLRRAIGWARDLERLGVDVPLPVIHDLGLLMAVAMNQIELGPRRALGPILATRPGAPEIHAAYVEGMKALSKDDTVERVRALRPSDDLIVVLLTRLLGSPAGTAPSRTRTLDGVDLTILPELERRLPQIFTESPRDAELQALARFNEGLLRLRVVLDTVDLDTIRLLAVLGQGSSEGAALPAVGALSGLAQVELLAALGSLQANDVVNFSLELLPAVLETKRRPAPGTFATGGYQGLTRKGSLDSLVLTELAWDDEELMRRIVDDEVLFHARERSEDEAARLHLVLVDASASMRGDRTTFARGVAIALTKRLELEGEEARIRFFDRRLYEPFAASSGSQPLGRSNKRGALASSLPHILAFRGEHGRSPERVLRQLLAELDVLRARDKRSPVVHLVTHAAFYASRSLVQEVKSRAALFAVFITPRGVETQDQEPEIDVDWLDVLDGYWAVDQQTLSKKADRSAKGREIVKAVPKAPQAEVLPVSIRDATVGSPASHGEAEPRSMRTGPISSRRRP